MRVNEIVLENFGKFLKKEVKFDSKRLYVVSGPNGSGKSTVFVEALAWCLYGNVWRGLVGDGMIRDGAMGCRVSLVTDKGVIERKKERGKGSIVRLNGRVISEKDLMSVVKMSKEVFFNSVVFGSNLSGLLFLGEGERKEIVGEIVYRDIDELISGLRDKKKIYESEKRLVESELKMVEDRLKELQQKKVELENKIFTEDSEEVLGIKVRVEELDVQERKIRESYEKILDEIESLREKLENLKMKKFSIEKELEVIDGKKKEITERRFLIVKEEKCPVCLREISGDYRNEIIKGLIDEFKKLEEMEAEFQQSLKRVNEEMRIVEKSFKEKMNEKIELKERLDKIMQDRKKYMEMLEERNEVLQELERLKQNLMLIIEEMNSVENRKKSIEGELEIKKLYVEGCDFWIDNLMEFKVKFFDVALGNFERVANEFLRRLTNRFSIELDYVLSGKKRLGEKFKLKVFDGKREVDFRRLSGGEKRLVTLGLNLSLNFLLSKIYAEDWNLVVFDEVFDGFDVKVRERVVDLLLELVEIFDKNVIVITHEDFVYREDEFVKVRMGE